MQDLPPPRETYVSSAISRMRARAMAVITVTPPAWTNKAAQEPRRTPRGRQGPISFDDRLEPLADTTLRAIDAALGARPDVGANLRAAPALSPAPPEAPSARNPRPDQALLTAGIFAYLAIAGWLPLRPRRDAASGSAATISRLAQETSLRTCPTRTALSGLTARPSRRRRRARVRRRTRPSFHRSTRRCDGTAIFVATHDTDPAENRLSRRLHVSAVDASDADRPRRKAARRARDPHGGSGQFSLT